MNTAEKAHASPRPRTPYREVLNTPGIARAHDFQRIVSYGMAVALILLIDLPTWRINTVLLISSACLLYTSDAADESSSV